MKLIIISGAEATCKSSIGKEISKKLGYSYHSKDKIKEKMFDTESRNTWDFKWYENHAKNVFFQNIKTLIHVNEDAIIESNFIGQDKKHLKNLFTPDVELIEIHCFTKRFLSFIRFVQRNESGNRHPGHHDRRWYLKVLFQSSMHMMNINIGAHNPTGLSSKTLKLDTTHFPNVDYEEIIQFVSS